MINSKRESYDLIVLFSSIFRFKNKSEQFIAKQNKPAATIIKTEEKWQFFDKLFVSLRSKHFE
jgi:hypothetical protein